ncbi:tyrosine-type recombinase/integrase [Lysinibacillus sphaericus]|uniref:tyrosine-type recombinase/integrase n=1 Tax=Lysinibacillus sphaericus TaxID=1421 RepID=UPI003F7947EC
MARRINELSASQIEMVEKKLVDDLPYKYALKWFIEDCEVRNLRPFTIGYYHKELKQFYIYLREIGVTTDMSEFSREDLKAIIKFMQEDRKLKTVTINTRLRAIRTFFNFLERERHISSENNPVKGLKLLKDNKQIMETFTKTEINKLLKLPNTRTMTGLRDYTMMLFMLETGVRVNELVNIHIHHVDMPNSRVLIASPKGHRQRYVPVQKEMQEQLKRYLKIRGDVECTYLWINHDDGALARHSWQQIMCNYGKELDIRANCHKFRHTFARMAVERGANPFELQAILGHSTLDQVLTYVNLFSNDVIKKHEKFSPLQDLDI